VCPERNQLKQKAQAAICDDLTLRGLPINAGARVRRHVVNSP
jgi:hypothetical protein